MAESLIVVLKSEITRLARKVVKSQIGSLQASSTTHRRDIAALKKQVAALEKQVRQLAKASGKVAGSPRRSSAGAPEFGSTVRFQARGLRTLRQRLGLSAGDLGKLAGVSAQSIYNWEAEKALPRQPQIAALAALRGLGKKEARSRLEALSQ